MWLLHGLLFVGLDGWGNRAGFRHGKRQCLCLSSGSILVIYINLSESTGTLVLLRNRKRNLFVRSVIQCLHNRHSIDLPQNSYYKYTLQAANTHSCIIASPRGWSVVWSCISINFLLFLEVLQFCRTNCSAQSTCRNQKIILVVCFLVRRREWWQ